jgi:hypothetical protein
MNIGIMCAGHVVKAMSANMAMAAGTCDVEAAGLDVFIAADDGSAHPTSRSTIHVDIHNQ